jgi:hypothetical protein
MDPARDTDEAAERVRLRLLRARTLGQRLTLLDDAIATGRMLARTGLRARFPDADDATIEREYFRLMLGPELGDRVWAARRSRA